MFSFLSWTSHKKYDWSQRREVVCFFVWSLKGRNLHHHVFIAADLMEELLKSSSDIITLMLRFQRGDQIIRYSSEGSHTILQKHDRVSFNLWLIISLELRWISCYSECWVKMQQQKSWNKDRKKCRGRLFFSRAKLECVEEEDMAEQIWFRGASLMWCEVLLEDMNL